MMVTVYLEGPTKASRRLSSLTTRVLALGWASWHTTLAASITGAAGQLGEEGVPKAGTNLPTTVRVARHPGPRGLPGLAGVFLSQERLPQVNLAGPSYGDHGRGRHPWVGQPSASLVPQAIHSPPPGVG